MNAGSAKQRIDPPQASIVRGTAPARFFFWTMADPIAHTSKDLRPTSSLTSSSSTLSDRPSTRERLFDGFGNPGRTAKMVPIARECSLETLQALFTRGGVERLTALFPTGPGRDRQTAL